MRISAAETRDDGILVGIVVRSPAENLHAQGSLFQLLNLSIQLPLDDKLQKSAMRRLLRNRERLGRRASYSRTSTRLGEKFPSWTIEELGFR